MSPHNLIRNVKLAALLALLLLLPSLAFGADGPVVAVPGGQVRGLTLKDGGAVFKGIPYAQPPLSDLRCVSLCPSNRGRTFATPCNSVALAPRTPCGACPRLQTKTVST